MESYLNFLEYSARKVDLRANIINNEFPYELIAKDKDKDGVNSGNLILTS